MGTTAKDIASTTHRKNPLQFLYPTHHYDTLLILLFPVKHFLKVWRAGKNKEHFWNRLTSDTFQIILIHGLYMVIVRIHVQQQYEKVFIEKSAHAPSISEDS